DEWARGSTGVGHRVSGVGGDARPAGLQPAGPGEEPDPFADEQGFGSATGLSPTPDTRHPTPDFQPSIPHVEVAAQPLRPIAQLWNSFIAAEGAGGLLIIDQHLAHERVLYERLVAGDGDGAVASQRLAMPATLALTHRQALA